jgi:branched-chain amino acid transport system permease protein
VVLTLSLNLIIGFTGQVSLGHAAFFGIGAYMGSVMVTYMDLPYILSFFAAFCVAGIVGVLLGIPTLRLRDDYLAIVTLGFGVIVTIVILNIDYLGGPDGIFGIPSPVIAGKKLTSKLDFFIFNWSVMGVTILLMYRITRSRVGRALKAIRDDEVTAQVMGINTTKYKILAFGLGAAFAGAAGSLYGSYIHYIQPKDFGLSASILVLCMVVIGGMGSIPGSIIGAFLLFLLPEFFRYLPGILEFVAEGLNLTFVADYQVFSSIADYQNLMYGAALVLLLIVRPQGLMGKYRVK